MKKIVCCLLILLLNIPTVHAESYIIINTNDDQIIESKDEHVVQSIASITKIMTALVALEQGDFTDMWVVGDEILTASGSSIYLVVGQQVSMRSLLYGLMLKSGNDAAIAIADRVSGSVDQFVEKMNEKAKQIGMNDTVFNNPHGLDVDMEGNYSTPYDMALLMKEALKNPMFCEIIGTEYYTSEWGSRWHNSNELLNDFPFCIGGKTGFTNKAGRTFVSAAVKDDAQYVIVTFNMQDRFEFHQQKYEEVMNERTLVTLIPTQTLEVDNYVVEINEPFEVVASQEEITKGEIQTYLDKEKKEYVVQWYYKDHQKMKTYPAVKKKLCIWRWCF